ncbi:unnamed protein product [marine sediment metagenome]|uniref:Uncharacterized protein n=1 Tax=marine sediment metagenome TaxID=412755 RepID=X1PKD3_9ZZZZ
MIKIRQADENDLRAIRILLKELEESTKSHHDIKQIELNKLFKEMSNFPAFYSNYVAVKDIINPPIFANKHPLVSIMYTSPYT